MLIHYVAVRESEYLQVGDVVLFVCNFSVDCGRIETIGRVQCTLACLIHYQWCGRSGQMLHIIASVTFVLCGSVNQRRRSRHRLCRHLIDIQLLLQELDMILEDKPEDIDDKQWTRINLHACAFIRSFIVKELKYSYMKETYAKKLWMKLEEKYMTKRVENQLFLKKQLIRFQYRLANIDVEIPDEDKALCLLNSLPDDYDHLTTTLMYGKSEVKLDEVSAALVNHKCRKKEQKTQNSQTEAFVARGRIEERKSRKRGKSCSKSRGKFPAKDECAFCR
ncbi:unnamed protein product [Prunus armeniaca]|uniref:Retrovirus-related Pol polyprotein from transposon TNT 1-94 n=1 Tax=Prunus armeniaca TaxID=36596 RepID=A0A6J5TNK2_PRUAR|nr:unnamed protein product [Prunus armeniaca]